MSPAVQMNSDPQPTHVRRRLPDSVLVFVISWLIPENAGSGADLCSREPRSGWERDIHHASTLPLKARFSQWSIHAANHETAGRGRRAEPGKRPPRFVHFSPATLRQCSACDCSRCSRFAFSSKVRFNFCAGVGFSFCHWAYRSRIPARSRASGEDIASGDCWPGFALRMAAYSAVARRTAPHACQPDA